MKKIIILLSAYNGEKFISEQLESLLKMRIPDKSEIKIVIRDDGSSDNTLKILESYEKKYTTPRTDRNPGNFRSSLFLWS